MRWLSAPHPCLTFGLITAGAFGQVREGMRVDEQEGQFGKRVAVKIITRRLMNKVLSHLLVYPHLPSILDSILEHNTETRGEKICGMCLKCTPVAVEALWDVLKRLHRCGGGTTTPQATRLQAKQLAKVGIVTGGRHAMLWSSCQ